MFTSWEVVQIHKCDPDITGYFLVYSADEESAKVTSAFHFAMLLKGMGHRHHLQDKGETDKPPF
jgi:hypothetical protein